ncbi:MAG: hypothetical protein VW972_03830 [Flavobacteriaceae bacterium]|jgi:hypothetical protein
MKLLRLSLVLLFFQSCITIKVYPTVEENTSSQPLKQNLSLLDSGKTVILNGEAQPLFFHGPGEAPMAVFHGVTDSVTQGSRVIIRLDSMADTTAFSSGKSISWVSVYKDRPLVAVDGQVQDKDFKVGDLSTDDIATVNVLKGQAALDKYGPAGTHGVIEIVTKK